jgi:DNA mismatch repair ATPase MutS
LVLVATHDNELAENSMFKKYYFESHIESADVIFNYRICEGICQESNAIALLSVLNYPDEIIRNAKENLK